MKQHLYATPEYITGLDIKNVRNSLGISQKDFAALIHCSKATVERWEISKEPINGPIVLLLEFLKRDTAYINNITIPAKEFPLRLWYMHRQTPCTLIDVDEINKAVSIRNFTNNIMFCAFGTEQHPTYTMYEEFLESRCFPRERDKMKLILKELDLPFYDPVMIIEKTQGRMAEDDFWIKFQE